MKILQLSYSDSIGGANIAAYKLHRSLVSSDINSELWCIKKVTKDITVKSLHGVLGTKINGLKNRLIQQLLRISGIIDYKSHSLNIFSSGISKRINESDFDLINLHWVAAETISIKEIGKIKKPLVWTIHDLWPVLGSVYQKPIDKDLSISNNICDIWTLNRKKKFWKELSPHLVVVSNWLKKEIENNDVFKNYKINVIPNIIDVSVYKRRNKTKARVLLNLPLKKKIILLGAPDLDYIIKGLDLFIKSLRKISNELLNNVVIVTFGKIKELNINVSVKSFGYISNKTILSNLYSAADLVCVPSRKETFGLVAAEAMACGTPVVAFSGSGLNDIIDHKKNGYLAIPYDTDDFARGILWILEKVDDRNINKNFSLHKDAIDKINNNFSEQIVIKKYVELYRSIL